MQNKFVILFALTPPSPNQKNPVHQSLLAGKLTEYITLEV
jgi:hypothetical protein